MIKVLLVEDDLDLAGNIIDYLELDDIVCDLASNGLSALNFLADSTYQVVVLDINLPRLDGLSVCEKLRSTGNDTPVIMLTARDQLEDKLAGFEKGADDYLVKPFAMQELSARVQALSTRRSGTVKLLSFGSLNYNIKNKQITYNNRAIKLSPTGTKLLECLLRQAPQPVSKAALMQAIWGEDLPDSNSLKVHVHHVRKALASEGDQVRLHTQTSVGFSLILSEENA